MKYTTTAMGILCGWIMATASVSAQYPGGYGGGSFGGSFGGGQFARPTVSPYLNINRGGDPAINYYGATKPQFAYNRAIQNLGAEVQGLGGAVNYLDSTSAANQQLSQTGHRTSFMTQYSYFMNNGYAGRPQQRPGMGQPGGQSGRR